MSFQIIRIVAAGVIAGFVLFAIPFLLFKALFFFLFIGLLFRLFGRRRFGQRGFRRWDRYDHYEFVAERDATPFESKERLRDPFNHNPKNI